MHSSEAIRRARLEEGLSQKDLATALGVAQTNVSQWERGGSRPKARNLKKLSEVLNRPVSYFLPTEEELAEPTALHHSATLATPGPDSGVVPLVSTLPMGDPAEVLETTDVLLRVTPSEAAGCDCAFRVVGNSMYPFFWDGDIVGVKFTEEALDHQVVVARLANGESTIKQFRQHAVTGEAWLEPLNKSYPALRGEDFQVKGIVLWIRKTLPGAQVPVL